MNIKFFKCIILRDEVIKMDDKRFTRRKNTNQPNELEEYLNNSAKYQTVKYPRKLNAYDPWADWFNSSFDMGEKWAEYYSKLEQGKTADFGGNDSVNDYLPSEEENLTPVSEVPLAFQDLGTVRKTEEKEVNTEEEEVKTIINIKEEVLDTINKEQTSISKDIIIWKEFPNENIR
jgi:hypothetical protein